MIKRKLLCGLLSFVMVIQLFAPIAFAEEDSSSTKDNTATEAQVIENVEDSNNAQTDEKTPQTTEDSITITDIGQPPTDEEEYKIWKQNLVNQMNPQPQMRLNVSGASGNKVYNDFLEFALANNGRFTIGTTGGNPDNPNDNYKKMLYGHPSPSTSFSTIKVDGSNYIFNTQTIESDESDLSTRATQNINGVDVVQELKIVANSSTGKADTVQIKYTATNQSSTAHTVGTRIMMDTMLGNNDAAPFMVPGNGAVTTELELTGDDIPDYWQAFDSLTNPSVIAQGTLLRTENKPDKVQFSNWSRVYNSEWDFTVRPGSSNGDSAVTLYWNPTTLQPGESKSYVTYYGLSEFMQDLDGDFGLTLNRIPSIEATTSGYYPNPIAVTGYITNNGNATLENVKAKITLPFGMRVYNDETEIEIGSIASGAMEDFEWDVVLPEFETETNLNYTVEVSADGVDSKSLVYNFTVPATKVDSGALQYYEGAKYSIGAYNILTGQSAAIVDPVDAATGNFILNNTDIMVSGYNPISFNRFYNSVDNWEGSLGKNWHTNYEITLTKLSDEKLSIRFDDGHIEEYTKDFNGIYQPMPGKYGVVEFIDGQGYQLTQKDKSQYTFDMLGSLTAIKDISGNITTLSYDSGKLFQVQNECGSLQFEYSGDLLSKITDNAGRTIEYSYNNGNLIAVKDVDGYSTSYVYDDTNRLVVIIDPAGNAKVTNEYDSKNRVLKQTMADGTVNTMSYDDINKTTTLTDRNGAQIIYKWDEQYRIYETVFVNGIEKAVFNEKSQKTSYTDKNGNTYNYEYDSNGNIVKEANPLGQIYEYTYDVNNKVTSIKKPDSSMTTYGYDEKGNLVSAKDPLNREMKIEYNERSLPVKMILPDGSTSTLAYDEKGNVISVTDPLGNTTSYKYDEQNRIVGITKPKGNRISFVYTPSGKIKKVINSDGSTTETTYDSRGLAIEEKDGAGNITKSKYDSMGHLIEKTDALGNVTKFELDSMWNISKVILPNGAESEFHYDDANLLETVSDPLNNTRSFEYDSNGNLMKESDFEGNQTIYAYDALNRLIQVTDANHNSTKYEYGSNGEITKVVDALQQATQYEYDAAGQLTKVMDVMGNTTSYEYNSLGQVVSITDAKGAITKYQYNALGKVVKVSNPDGSQSSFEYDGNGNLTKSMDAKGNMTTYTYDEMDRVIVITNTMGGKEIIQYTPTNQISEIKDENGNATKYRYDALDRLVEVTDAKGNHTKYEYDALGNLKKVQKSGGVDQDVLDKMKIGKSDEIYASLTQAADMITTYEYDVRGLLSKEINPAGKINSFKYDKNGNLLSKTDRDGLRTQFDYDNIGNIEKVVYDDGKQINYEYNPLGQMTKIIDWLGTTSFELDALGRITKVNDYRNKTVEYTWSATGEKLSMKYPDGSLANYDYDSMGRLQKVTDADQASTTYKYDLLGNVTEKLLPNGMKTEYSYDALSRLTSMTNKDNKGKLVDAYNYAYDAVGNKTSIERKHTGDGLLASVLDPTEGMTKYQYDSLHQLTEVTNPNKTAEKYFYDKLGNRIRHDYVAFNKVIYAENYNYDSEGRLSEVSGSSILDVKGKAFQDKVKMEYDNRGNVTKTLFGDKVLSEYTFDAANKLEKVINWKNEATTFSYDGLGRRVSQSIEKDYLKNSDIGKSFDELKAALKDKDSVLSNYLKTDDAFDYFKSGSKNIFYTMDITSPYNNLIEMEDSTTNSTFVYGLDVISITDQKISNQGSKNLINLKSSVQKNYYLQDELESPIRLVDSKGKTTERYSYDEFGTPNGLKMALGLSKSSNPFGYTGYQYNTSTGLYFAQARYYAAGVGRFISEDAYRGVITNPLSLNLYTYVYNNPLKYIDPSGNDAIIVTAKEAAGGAGHTSALFQDKKNDWFYTYWGNKGVVVEKVNVNSLKGLNNWIKSQGFSEWSTKGYTSSTYVAGDFTQSLQFFRDKKKNFNGTMEEKNKDYRLIAYNCLEVTSEALSLGVLNDGTSVKHFIPNMIIPNNAKDYFEDHFYNNAFTLDEYTKQLKNKLDYYDSSRPKEFNITDENIGYYKPGVTNREFYQAKIKEINSLLSK